MVIAKGLEPGEVVALADPTRQERRQEEEAKSGGGAMGALPGGGK